MKLNIANPTTGCNKIIDIDDDKKLHIFYDKRISQEVDATPLGENFKGYILRITGGADKQGFPMKQGILVNGRVKVLLDGRTGCFRPRRADGLRKRRSIRGAICGPDLAVINLIVVKKGVDEIDGLTNKTIPRRLGPKRASKIRKLFSLSKEDDVRKYVIRRSVPRKGEDKKPRSKAPKIQRLVTPLRLQRKRRLLALKKRKFEKSKADALRYKALLQKVKAKDAEETKKRKAKAAAKLAKKKAKVEKPAAAAKKVEEKPAPKAEKKEKPAPKKTEEKPAPKKVEAKPAPKKAEAKPAPKAEKPAPKKAEAKPAAPAPKKAEAKPAAPAPKKAEVKPAPKKAEAKPAAPTPKKVEEKPAPKKTEAKPAPKAEKPAPKKAEAKPAAPAPKEKPTPAPTPKKAPAKTPKKN